MYACRFERWLPYYCGGNSSVPSNSGDLVWPERRGRQEDAGDLPVGEVPGEGGVVCRRLAKMGGAQVLLNANQEGRR